MEQLLPVLGSLSRQCAAITFTRHSCSRNTRLKRKLNKLNLPLVSVLHRLRRGLVLCEEAEFEQHVRSVLARFHVAVHSLTRSLENGSRTPQVLALMDAVQGFERMGYIS